MKSTIKNTVVTGPVLAVSSMVLAGAMTSSAQTYAYPVPPPPPSPGYVLPGPAWFYAEPDGSGPYVTFEAGPTIYQNGTLTSFGGPVSAPVQYDAGFSADVDFGYNFNRYVAAGLEFGLNSTTINNIPGYFLSDAQFYNIPFMANVTFSLPLRNSWVTPYAGFGVGGSDSVLNPSIMADSFNNTVSGEADDVVFAWEAFAGLRFQLNPSFSVGVGYKYFGTTNPNFSYPPSPNFNVGISGIQSHSIMVSANFSF